MTNFNQTQFEKRVQRAQKAIAAIGKNLDHEAATPELIAKVGSFLEARVEDLVRDLEALRYSGIKRGVFSLNAPADPTPERPIRITHQHQPPAVPLPFHPDSRTGTMFPPAPGPMTSIAQAVGTTVKASEVVGKMAPPDVAKEVLKTAENAPDRVRVFGGHNAPLAAASDGDVDFQEE